MKIARSVFFALWLSFFLANPVYAAERITDFDIKLVVQPDGDLIVTETIAVIAEGDKIKRGIYRDFPTAYRTVAGFHEYVDFDVLEVLRDGQPEPHFISVEDGYQRLYIGDANRYVSRGDHAYKITYRTSEQIGFFPDRDELYWNLIGTYWAFPIENVSAEIILPRGAVSEDISIYTGQLAERGHNYQVTTSNGNRVALRTKRPLAIGEGVTLSVSWQKGLLVPPTSTEEVQDFIVDNLGFVIGVLSLILLVGYYFYVWSRFGKDPEKGTIIPLFEPPENLSAVALGFINARGFSGGMATSRALTVGLTSLGVKGFITIEDLDEKSGTKYVLRRTNKEAVGLPPAEKVLLDKLFDEGGRKELSLGSAYDSTFDRAKKAFLATIRKEYTHAYFRTNGGKWFAGAAVAGIAVISSAVWSLPIGDPMILAGALALFASVAFTFFFVTLRSVLHKARSMLAGRGFWPFLLSVLVLIAVSAPTGLLGFGVYATASLPVLLVIVTLVGISFLFFDLMEAPTIYGRQIMDKIDGYILFLTTTEWDRMRARGTMPMPNTAMFEKHLPYSIALGVDEEWTRTFTKYAEAASVPPSEYQASWYQSRRGHRSDFSGFSKSLSAGLGSTIASASTPPSSSRGSSGGGSSGGGGGGGGGGGW